ncbi:MAG TPA: glycosyltransferase [Solirubrobacterales bacterium]
MNALSAVSVGALSPERFRDLLGDGYEDVERGVELAREIFAGRVVWHINSTAKGGGVVELLQSLLAYARGAGVDNRWAVIRGEPGFFEVTKRIHNRLHGSPGDGGGLGDRERGIYEAALTDAAAELAEMVRPRDVVFLHDPQTAGMVEALDPTGATVVWRCHVGLDLPNDLARDAWDFLRLYVEGADAFVFSRREYAWEGLDPDRIWVVPPSIDAFSPKNQELEELTARSIFARTGLGDGDAPDKPTFVRMDGTPGRVDRRAEIDQDRLIPEGVPLVTQVSRWDRLKDPLGVIDGFARLPGSADAHLLLAGPSVADVADDPEGVEVLAEVRRRRLDLPAPVRERVHLACLPMDDVQENAAIVNAIQRRSDIVVQKSLAEGFGLTVAEAMWKSRAVIASRVGGIQDQVTDGESGVLLDDPSDLGAYSEALAALLGDPERRARIGAAARARVEDRFLGTRHLIQYLELLAGLIDPTS